MIGSLDNEKEIVKNCQRGDLRSYQKIYDHYKEPLFRVAFRMTGVKEDSEDILQMTFLRLYRGIKNFRFGSKLGTYLFQILINLCYDFNQQKREKNRKTIDESDLFYQPQNQQQLQLEEAIQSLPVKMRECFVLFAVEGFKQQEIAEMMNITAGAVKAHIFQAKQKLKVSLELSLPGV